MTDAKKEDVSSGFGDDEAAEARRLIAEIEASEKYWQPYWKRCRKILKRYQDDRERSQSSEKRRFAILWSNTETLKPVCYAKVPKAVVARRNKDSDAVARIAAEVLERCVNYSLESYDFDQVLKDIRDEFLLLGKGQSWTRYVPTFEEAVQPGANEQKDDGTKEEGKKKPTASAEPPVEKLKYEEAVCDYVAFDDWGTNPARGWAEVRLVWRKVYMGRPALKKRFTKKMPGSKETVGALIPLDWKADGSTEDTKELFGKAVIYEVWDKDTGKAYWVSKSFPGAPLDVRDDPLGLKDFFPCPKPALGTTTSLSIIPVPDYVQYQDQAEELDELTGRIGAITKALRVVGVYAGDENVVLQNVFKDGAENKLIKIDGWDDFTQRGGLKGLIEWIPVEQIYNVLKGLYEAREDCIKTIYQIVAIPDIMRGDTDPDETAAAQGLKSTWGSSRCREKQKEMARFCRDEMNIKGEIIATKFSIETMKQMSGVQLLTREEKQVVAAYGQAVAMLEQQQKAMQPPAMPGQPPQPAPPPMQPPPPPFPPEKMELMSLPAWEDIDELFKSDAMRQFRIDIETDSTVEPDLASDKRDATEFVTAFGGFLANSLEVVKTAPPMGKVVGAIGKGIARRFNMGTELEDIIDTAMNEVSQMAPSGEPDPATVKAEAEKAAALEQVEKYKAELAKQAQEQQRLQMDWDKARLDARSKELDRVASERDDQWAARQTEMREQNDANKIAFEREKHHDLMALENRKLDAQQEALNFERSQAHVAMQSDGPVETDPLDAEAKALAVEKARLEVGRMARDLSAPPQATGEAADSRSNDAIGVGLQALAQAMSKPKSIIRGPDGRATGVE